MPPHEPRIEVTRRGAEWQLDAELWLPRPAAEVFPFFADAHNLETLTPPWLRFKILTPGPIQMREGALIRYRLSLHGVPLGWTTRIAAWQPAYRFVDEQLAGPFRLWVHEHTFEEMNGGTLVLDRVRYRAPGGALVHAAFVGRDVRRIFEFRQARLADELQRKTGDEAR